jgi:hypothetical protein
MENPSQVSAVRFHNVEFSAQSVALFDQQNRILSVLKKDIRQIILKYGFQSERPLAQAAFGVALFLSGLYFIANFILHILINHTVYTTMLLSVFLLPVGVWFVLDGFRKRLYFEVLLDNDKRKFPLGKNPDKVELQKFIQSASQLGYVINTTILNETTAKVKEIPSLEVEKEN